MHRELAALPKAAEACVSPVRDPEQTLDAGARVYVLKKSAAQCLVNAVRGVLVGGLYIDPAMAAHMFLPSGRPTPLSAMRMRQPVPSERLFNVIVPASRPTKACFSALVSNSLTTCPVGIATFTETG